MDTGVVVESGDGRTWYSAYLDPADVVVPDKPPFKASRALAAAKSRRLTPLGNVAQRMFMLTLGRFPRVEAWVKDLLRTLLITGVKKGKIQHERLLELPDAGLRVVDRVGPRRLVSKLWLSGKSSFVYGPSTRFFQPTSLDPAPIVLTEEDFPPGSDNDRLEVERLFDGQGQMIGIHLSVC